MPNGVVDLQACKVTPLDDGTNDNCFKIRRPDQTEMLIRAGSALLRHQWLEALEEASKRHPTGQPHDLLLDRWYNELYGHGSTLAGGRHHSQSLTGAGAAGDAFTWLTDTVTSMWSGEDLHATAEAERAAEPIADVIAGHHPERLVLTLLHPWLERSEGGKWGCNAAAVEALLQSIELSRPEGLDLNAAAEGLELGLIPDLEGVWGLAATNDAARGLTAALCDHVSAAHFTHAWRLTEAPSLECGERMRASNVPEWANPDGRSGGPGSYLSTQARKPRARNPDGQS